MRDGFQPFAVHSTLYAVFSGKIPIILSHDGNKMCLNYELYILIGKLCIVKTHTNTHMC